MSLSDSAVTLPRNRPDAVAVDGKLGLPGGDIVDLTLESVDLTLESFCRPETAGAVAVDGKLGLPGGDIVDLTLERVDLTLESCCRPSKLFQIAMAWAGVK